MAKSDGADMPAAQERSLFLLLRESGDALEAASPPFDVAAGAARLCEAAQTHGLLRAVDTPENDLAAMGANLEGVAPPFDVEAGAARLREAARTRGLLSGSTSEASRKRAWTRPGSAGQVLRQSSAFHLDTTVVEECLDPASAKDRLFARGWRSGPASLTHAERCAVAGVTGHVAESVIEVLLDRLDWRVLWHFTGPGRHGVDLLFLTPDDKVAAVEAKGTLTAGRIPRLSRREMTQMSAEWGDKADNPGMAELGLRSTDVYGAVAAVNFADMTWRVALTADFSALSPVARVGQLTNLSWLSQASASGTPEIEHQRQPGDVKFIQFYENEAPALVRFGMQKLVFAWHLDGYTISDIASELDTSPERVRNLLRRGRVILREHLGELNTEEVGLQDQLRELRSKEVKLRGGKVQRIYYLSNVETGRTLQSAETILAQLEETERIIDQLLCSV